VIKNYNVLVDLFKYYGEQRVALGFDVDLTLRNTMARDTRPEEHVAFMELYQRTGEGLFVMTGRSSASVDETLVGQYPGSFEHHSAIRLEQNGDIIALAPRIDTAEIGRKAAEIINGDVFIVREPRDVIDAEGKYACVYPEIKQFAVALVHSLGHSEVDAVRTKLQQVATRILTDMGIKDTHKIAVGSDAIEIVPLGLCNDSPAHGILPDDQISLLRNQGLSKSTGLHNLMTASHLRGRMPIVIGDSGTDGHAMNVAAQEFGGGGVWVSNGKPVPQQFKEAVDGRVISNFSLTWDHIRAANDYLRAKQRTVIVGPSVAIAPDAPEAV